MVFPSSLCWAPKPAARVASCRDTWQSLLWQVAGSFGPTPHNTLPSRLQLVSSLVFTLNLCFLASAGTRLLKQASNIDILSCLPSSPSPASSILESCHSPQQPSLRVPPPRSKVHARVSSSLGRTKRTIVAPSFIRCPDRCSILTRLPRNKSEPVVLFRSSRSALVLTAASALAPSTHYKRLQTLITTAPYLLSVCTRSPAQTTSPGTSALVPPLHMLSSWF